jgi:CDP-diacylglycerol--glycerol-3-phosphate 3-phosphatidyltransferase
VLKLRALKAFARRSEVLVRDQIRTILTEYFQTPGARLLRTLKLTPSLVSLLGLAINLSVGYLASIEVFLIAGILLLVAGVMDMLDGALARLTGTATKFGAVLDSTSDRFAEAAVLLGLLLLYLRNDSDSEVTLVFLVLVTSFMVSYLRSRGEGLGIRSNVGLMQRPERVVVLAAGFMVDQVQIALGIILLLSTLTIVQRFWHLWKETKDDGKDRT